MNRSINSVASRKKKKKILKKSKGYYGSKSKLYTVAKNSVEKALVYSYIGRKIKKRNFRNIWIHRINAFAKLNNLKYSSLINKLKKKKILLNRKSLTYLINNYYYIFLKIINNI
ncbi:MAG: 50S ribosomal protein L20 [Candidatus Shikimatogenerans sp. Tcar]|uniref:Large ribosomal subunit protein bL20 n=1 Tax=Candidatus Shikimatogenerans sp. Tcar TaxID=3158565 RepID=A0AAU7QV18_9FLAO